MQVPGASPSSKGAQGSSLIEENAEQNFYSTFTLNQEQAGTSPDLYREKAEQGHPPSYTEQEFDRRIPRGAHPENFLQKKKKQGFFSRIIGLWDFWNSLTAKKRLLLASTLPAVLSLFIALLFLSFYFLPSLYLEQAPLQYIERIQNNTPNQIVDRKGELIAELFSMKTGVLKASDIPQSMKDIIVFIEDQHFYEHTGIHWPAILRAALFNLFSIAYRQGGSTITQQLSRILLLEKQKTLLRKCKEAALAYALERELSKAEILTAYLNLVYLGHGAYGIASASQFYFRKELPELNFAQQLILASLPSAPERYSPLRHPHLLKIKNGSNH